MKTFSIDLTGVRYIGGIHLIIKSKLGFSGWYGENLDALWDLLTGYIEPCTIYIKGSEKVSAELIQYAQKVIDVFLEAEKTYKQIRVMVVNS